MDNAPESTNNKEVDQPNAGGATSDRSKMPDDSHETKIAEKIKATSEVGQALATAADFVIVSAVLAGLGVWSGTKLDEWLHSAPWFTIGLALIGATLGMVRMVLKASATEKK